MKEMTMLDGTSCMMDKRNIDIFLLGMISRK